jgi:hypothetical protein
VTIRKLPGAVGLGLLASLVAHAAIYGNEHAFGGNYNTTLLSLALAALLGFAFAVANLAWAGRDCCVGTILASRLAELVPPLPALALSASAWFTCGELIERAHAPAPFWLIAAALCAAAFGVRYFSKLLVRAVAAITIAIVARPFSARIFRAPRIFVVLTIARAATYLGRRFARPPPVRISSV